VQLHFVLAGSAIAIAQDASGRKHTIAEMTRSDFFGYSALLANEPSPITVTATEDIEVLVIQTDAVQKMLNQTPRFAQQLSAVIDARQNRLREINPVQERTGSRLSSSFSASASASKG
jgi:CRP-like cAMP-binding protein